MASYQDIDTRLVGVENALMFLMRLIKVPTSIPGSSLAINGAQVEMVDAYTLYQRLLHRGLELVASVPEPVEMTDGTDSVGSEPDAAAK